MRIIVWLSLFVWTLILQSDAVLLADSNTCVPFEYKGRQGDLCRLNGESFFMLPKHWRAAIAERVSRNDNHALKLWQDLSRIEDTEARTNNPALA